VPALPPRPPAPATPVPPPRPVLPPEAIAPPAPVLAPPVPLPPVAVALPPLPPEAGAPEPPLPDGSPVDDELQATPQPRRIAAARTARLRPAADEIVRRPAITGIVVSAGRL
jgi:hypothetical protein